MKQLITRFCIILAVLILPATTFSLELTEGRMKLVLHEGTGRFSLYYLSDIKKDRYEPLFVDQDPRTSSVALSVDDRALRMGDSPSFRTKVEQIDSGGRIVFESSSLSITQEFVFVRTSGASLADGVKMTIRVTNRGEQESAVGIRFLIDTKNGEKSENHFTTDKRTISSETLLTAKDGDRWWFSRNDRVGFMGSLYYSAVTAPDSVHFSNWKRLNDAPWKISASPGRNFNLLPYSIDDSAICYYFEPKALPRGESRVVSILLAAATDSGFDSLTEAPEDDLSRIMKESVSAAESPDLALRTDLITVRDLIERIDAAIASGGNISDEELAAMEAVVARLKERDKSR